MSINLKKVYFKKLEEYVGKKLNIVSNENEITIIYDVETSYVLQEEKEIFYFYCIQFQFPVYFTHLAKKKWKQILQLQ